MNEIYMKYAKERGLDTKDMEEWMNYAQTYGIVC